MLDVVPVLARPRPRRLPPRRRALPVRARRHQRREPARDPRVPAAAAQGGRRRVPRAGCCWPRPTSGRPTSSTTSATATSATCASTSRSCPACSWRSGGSSATRSPRSWPQTPEIPDGCQWGIFLRNHDELTLEMVTDEERDYMYARVRQGPADEAQRRHRAGGCSRCSTTTGRVAELFHALLFSLPGQPGPLLRRRDRHGRQHLPRRPRRRAHPDAVDAGPQRRLLARADFAQLYLPPLMDPVYGYQAVNVEAAAAQPELVPALGAPHARGPHASTRCSAPARSRRSAENPSVLAYLRRRGPRRRRPTTSCCA